MSKIDASPRPVEGPSPRKLARRSFLVALGTAVTAPLQTGAAPGVDDTELVTLAEELIAVVRERRLAADRAVDLDDKFDGLRPELPRALLWRGTDPVGYRNDIAPEDGDYGWPFVRGRTVCSRAAVQRLRGTPLLRRGEFIGTDEEWERGDDRDELWTWKPDAKGQARLNEIVATGDRYEADLAALRRELGLNEADARCDELASRVAALSDQITAMSATTLDGLRAKARVCAWELVPDDDLEDIDFPSVMWSILRDLMATGASSAS